MSILIKGMEMPESCASCRFYGVSYCYAKGDEDAHSTAPCPLVELPPHGRLIDANPIMKFIQDGLNNGEFGYDQIKVMGEIQYAPTIVPAEE